MVSKSTEIVELIQQYGNNKNIPFKNIEVYKQNNFWCVSLDFYGTSIQTKAKSIENLYNVIENSLDELYMELKSKTSVGCFSWVPFFDNSSPYNIPFYVVYEYVKLTYPITPECITSICIVKNDPFDTNIDIKPQNQHLTSLIYEYNNNITDPTNITYDIPELFKDHAINYAVIEINKKYNLEEN